MDKNRIIADVRRIMNEKFGPDQLHDRCVDWARHTVMQIRNSGTKAFFRAGTAIWPVVMHAERFGYLFEQDSEATKNRFAQWELPEMHVWVFLSETKTVVDLTTGLFPKQRMSKLGRGDWEVIPPDHLWHPEETIEKSFPGVVYEHSDAALAMVLLLMEKQGTAGLDSSQKAWCQSQIKTQQRSRNLAGRASIIKQAISGVI